MQPAGFARVWPGVFSSLRESLRTTLPAVKSLSQWGETASREFSSGPRTRWANSFVVCLCRQNDREKVHLAGHVTDILPLTNVAMPLHLQHGSLPATKTDHETIS